MAKKDRVVKNDGSYIFADFSKGLYLLDTPRGLGEQLGSLALVDGRNVWAEKGALIPQYGYEIRATLPKTKNSKGDELTQDIKGYTISDLSADNVMVLSNSVRSYFDISSFNIEGTLSHTGTVYSGFSLLNYIANTVDIPANSEIEIEGSFTPNVTGIDCEFGLGNDTTRYISVYVAASTQKISFTFLNTNATNSLVQADFVNNQEYEYKIKITGSDAECYINGDLVGSIDDYDNDTLDALVIGIDNVLGTPANESTIDLAKTRVTVNGTVILSGMVDTIDGNVYLYSASQGLKKYKTIFSGGFTDPIIARRGKDLLVYDGGILKVFGAYYGNSSVTNVQITAEAVPFQDYSSFGIIRVPLDEAQYFWTGKELLIDTNPCTVTLVSIGRDDDYAEVRVAPFSGSFDYVTTPATVIPYEKTELVATLTYVPEDEEIDSTTLVPQMMAVSNNRLFIEHSNGNIYYSSIGFAFTDSNYDIINPFEEAGGAGYFGGFYNDTTRLLSIEDYFNGVLLTKENGFYYLTISTGTDSQGNITNSVQVDKISQAGQRYPSDHVIVGNDVYAYDANSGSLVKASQANVFGALVAGKTLVASEFLNVANFNINSGKRFLTYNYESQVLILYYGEDLKRGVVYSIPAEALFPRELDKVMLGYTGFNQGVIGITERGELMQDFKRGMIIPNLSCVAQFEPIGVRDNRMICSTILEVTELNGIDYDVTTQNAGSSYQQIQPSFYIQNNGEALLPFIYSEDDYLADSYQLTSRWAEISSHRTRIYAPMSGRNGVTIQLEFEADKPFCLSMLRLPDFCQGN